MRRTTTLIIAVIAFVCSTAAATQPPVTFESPCSCRDNHAKGRWAVKNDPSTPPTDATAIHAVTPSDVFSWPGPDVQLTGQSERTGIENKWFALTGRVVAVKAETDGDIHIALQDATGDKPVVDANKKFTVVMTFDQNIISVGSASSTCGTVQSIVIDGTDAHKVNFNLVGVAHACNGSTITITANSISDDQGGLLSSASVPIGLLLGDVNGDRVVNRLDTNEAQMRIGQRTVQQNYRNDVNTNGHIEHSDIQLIQQQNGTSLP